MLMTELAAAVKYRLPIKVVIIKNDTLGQIKWEPMVFLGNPEYGLEVVVEALVDPLEPPLPAKVTLEQAALFAKSLVCGGPNRERIALMILSDKVREQV